METLERFEINRRVIEDVTARTLAAIPTDYGRLLYLASLRDPESGRYVHDGLEATFPAPAVQQALAFCHEEIFARILESPLESQEWDLRACLGSLEADLGETAAAWTAGETYAPLPPAGLPEYLSALFRSNVRNLLALFLADRPTWRSAA